MHSRRAPGVSPLAIVLPHPPLPTRRSSLLSLSSSPQTPRSCRSPATSAIFFAPSRRSTDSWNSSNADELEWEWKAEQVLLLSRTLDALPAHLVTPFNGPIPPPNLLDKIARGVSHAKGPIDWPHSIRATRVKLIELSRLKAKEEALAQQRRNLILEETEVEIADASSYSYIHDDGERPIGIGGRRPLYKQSSMDFLEPAGTDPKQTDNIARLSSRLQRSDRGFSNTGYHPYSRRTAQARRRSTSPPPLAKVPSLISPSTQSSDTIDSLDSSFGSDLGANRRSVSSLGSSMSIITDGSSGIAIPDPRVQRIRRSESMSMVAPTPPPKDRVKPVSATKRAPAYGAMAQEVRREHIASHGSHVRRDSGSYPSSDEEEKHRTKHAKKLRTEAVAPALQSPLSTSSALSSPLPRAAVSPMPPPVPEKDRTYVRTRTKVVAPAQDENANIPAFPSKTKKLAKVDNAEKPPVKRSAPMNLQRNPSMFGPELPNLPKASGQNTAMSPIHPRGVLASPKKIRPSSPAPIPLSPLSLSPSAHIVPTTPQSPSPRMKTLRRVKRLAPARRISFGSLLGDDNDGLRGESDQRSRLGSAFQML